MSRNPSFFSWVPFYFSCLVQCTLISVSFLFVTHSQAGSTSPMSIMLERVTSLRVDVVSSLIFCVLSSLSCVLSHFLGCPLPAGVVGVRHMGCRLPRLTHHDTSYNVWEDFQTQTNVLPNITWRTESRFHHRCKASLW